MSYIGNTPGVSSQRVVLEEVISGSPKSSFIPIGGYIKGYVDVLVNGHELDSADFTANDGVTVGLVVAADPGDTVKIKTWLPRGLSDGYLKSEVDTLLAAIYTKTAADARYLQLAGGTLSGNVTIGTAASGNVAQLALGGYNASGGTGYHGFLSLTNTYPTGTNPNKYFRLSSTGTLQVVNSAYSATIFTLDDAGNVGFAGSLSGGSVPLARLTSSGTTALSGTADNTTFLRGDGSWAALASNRGVYDSGWYSVAKDTSYVKTHNLGGNNLLVLNYFSYDAATAAFLTFTSFHSSSHSYTGGCVVADITSTTLTIRTGANDCAGPSPYPNSDTMRFGGVDHLTSGGIAGYYRTLAIRLG